MSSWRQAGEASDSDDDVVFMGPVTERELEISRLLNDTICLPDNSDSVGDTMADLEDGLRAVALEGTRESCTMHELELPAAPGDRSYPVTSSRLLEESAAAPLASSEDASSRHWQELRSEQPLSSTHITEESRQWEELPSELHLSVPGPAEESRQWEELPSESHLSVPAPAEESQQWEELPSEYPLSVPAPAAEESQQWEELPSEYPLSVPAPAAEESQQWEELPSEYPLSVPAPAEVSVYEEEEEEVAAAADGSHWRTLASDESDLGPGDSLDERRETSGALLGALSDELAAPSSPRASAASPRAAPVSPRSPSGGGLLQVMHRQLCSPGGASVAASVDSYHTCYGDTAADNSRRLTGLSELSLAPAAPPNSTLGDDQSEASSLLYESSVEEQTQPSVAEVSRASAADDTTSDNASRSPSLVARDRTVSLASECSLASSCMSGASTGSQSELNDTLEMMERLLAMEAEERRLETILQSRTAAGESGVLSGAAAADDAPGGGPPAEEESVTPGRPTKSAAGVQTAPVPVMTRRGRPAALTPRQQHTPAARSPARLMTPRGRVAASPARSAAAPAPAGRLRTPAGKAATLAPPPTTPRTRPNLKDIVSPVARYIHDGPEPTLVQNLRPRVRVLNSVVPQPRPTPQKLAPLAEEGAATQEEKVLRDLNISSTSNASNSSNVSGSSGGSRIPVKVTARGAGGQENRKPPQLPKVSYKSSGNLVMDKTAWNRMVRKNTAENRKVGRFVPSPSPVLAVKHTGHKSVSTRRVKWNDEFSVPDMAVRVRPIRRSVSDCDLTQTSDASYMEVSVCEVRSVRPAVVRH